MNYYWWVSASALINSKSQSVDPFFIICTACSNRHVAAPFVLTLCKKNSIQEPIKTLGSHTIIIHTVLKYAAVDVNLRELYFKPLSAFHCQDAVSISIMSIIQR